MKKPTFLAAPLLSAFLLLFSYQTPAISEVPLRNVASYDELLNAIRQTRAASQARVEAAVEAEKVREAWETGKLIDEHILLHKERAKYGEQVIIKLAEDLGTSETELRYMLLFARTYPIHPSTDELPWGHYRELLSLNDAKQRAEIAVEASRKGWTQKELREEIKKRRLRVSEEIQLPLEETKPGTLNTYQTFRQEGRLKIDLGFDTYFDLPLEYEKKVNEGEILILDGSRNLKRATLNDLYTYQAKVTQIVDGDTFYALIDLGFGITLYQRLRLRRLDAPEIVSAEGKEAKEVLEKILFRNKGPILIKISKTDDQYGRYLADVWVKDKNIDQELLDTGVFQVRGDA